MIETKKRAEENPYRLSVEELTYPGVEGREWVNQLATRQREGIDHGVRPQLPRGLSPDLWQIWRRRVWKYYVDKQPLEVRQVINRTVKSEIEWSRRRRENEKS